MGPLPTVTQEYDHNPLSTNRLFCEKKPSTYTMYVSSKGFVSVDHDLFRVSSADVGQIED